MPRTHYELLGVKKTASADEIRSAYRSLVLKLHPDRSKDPKSTEMFIRVTQAYECLSDPHRRRQYDASLELEARARQESQQVRTAQYGGGTSPGYPPPREPVSRGVAVTMDVTKLSMLFSRGQLGEAERLARRIIATDPRQPLPYAVLGDLARSRGNTIEAGKMYSMAVQMDPSNALYQQRYEQLLREEHHITSAVSPKELTGAQLFAPLIGIAMVLLACMYVAVGREPPVARDLSLISTWTLGLIVMLFLGGVAVGASLATAGLLDRLHTLSVTSVGRPAPTVALAFVAAVSFWAAAALYLLLGVSQKAFNFSTSRVMAGTAAATVFLAASAATSGIIDGFQVLFWGGNLVYLGSLCGWTVADSFRR